jgi:hypothetical protein
MVIALPSQIDFIGVLISLFAAILIATLVRDLGIFTKKHGRSHAITGAVYLSILAIGFTNEYTELFCWETYGVVYHYALGVTGIILTSTAAYEFKHKNVKNIASGTLDEHATVTYSEMIEHSFYQYLNLAQIVFFHAIALHINLRIRCALLMLVATSLWLVRDHFPINKFSDNYLKIDEKSTDLIRILYRIKKYQYVFYKHFLLHGLNISVALYSYDVTKDKEFRLYWLLLNTSYTMEFFLQTLVKKKYLKQTTMLLLQGILMAAATISAVQVLRYSSLFASVASLLLNFVHRKHDVTNTLFVLSLTIFCTHSLELFSSCLYMLVYAILLLALDFPSSSKLPSK